MSSTSSLCERLAALPAEVRREVLAGQPAEVLAAAAYGWRFWARPD